MSKSKINRRASLLVPVGIAAALCAFAGTPAPAEDAGAVTDGRLLGAHADPKNWLKFGQGYDNQHYSSLTQINRTNVGALAPRWVYQTGLTAAFQAEPLEVDGTLYLTMPFNHVAAIDAATGKLRWRYNHTFRQGVVGASPGGPANRGAALGYGKIYEATNDGRLIALDQTTGKLVWDTVYAAPTAAEIQAVGSRTNLLATLKKNLLRVNAKMPPLVYDGMVIMGTISGAEDVSVALSADGKLTGPDAGLFAGGDFNDFIEARVGERAYIAAFDANTGTERWRWNVTGPGWEGDFAEKTPDGLPLGRDIATEKTDAARYHEAWWAGGGTTWSTPALDPQLGLIYVGTGNPSPGGATFLRPGDNLYTSSVVALDVHTGKIAWYFQLVPHDEWGFDVNSQPVLFDLPGRGAAVGVATKLGVFYVFDRKTGALWLKSEPVVPVNNTLIRSNAAGVPFAPGSFGGVSWSPVSYDERTGVVFVAGIHWPAVMKERVIPAEGKRPAIRLAEEWFDDGKGKLAPLNLAALPVPGPETFGTLTALDTRNGGKIKWQVRTEKPLVGGVLATAGGVVFFGQADGHFSAVDADTGAELWSFQTGAGVSAPPIAYEVNGTEYIAVAAGGNTAFSYAPGDSFYVFALPKQ